MTASKAEKARKDKAKRDGDKKDGGEGAKGMAHRTDPGGLKKEEAKVKRDAVKAAKAEKDAKAPKK